MDNKKLLDLAESIELEIAPQLAQIATIKRNNTKRLLEAFWGSGLAECQLAGTTGYGYDDQGRQKLDQIFAKAMGAEAALVRHQFCSGTHVLAAMLRSLLTYGDELVIVSGEPYDTLRPTLGLNTPTAGSLRSLGITITVIDLLPDGAFNHAKIKQALASKPKVVYVQKSRGYSTRGAFTNEGQLRPLFDFVRRENKNCIIAVDNCYGEFVESTEPCMVGADLVGGSLIKNAGGGIAPTGGYIAGRADLVERAAEQLTAIGIGSHVGATLGHTRLLAQGLYLAPQIVAESMQSALFVAALFKRLGYEVFPEISAPRGDLVQAIKLGTAAKLIAFCQAIQSSCPVDSRFAPIPAPMPGYDCDIIMASGSFIAGSSIELSADGPLREPFLAFFQGGLSFENGRLAALAAAISVEGETDAI